MRSRASSSSRFSAARGARLQLEGDGGCGRRTRRRCELAAGEPGGRPSGGREPRSSTWSEPRSGSMTAGPERVDVGHSTPRWGRRGVAALEVVQDPALSGGDHHPVSCPQGKVAPMTSPRTPSACSTCMSGRRPGSARSRCRRRWPGPGRARRQVAQRVVTLPSSCWRMKSVAASASTAAPTAPRAAAGRCPRRTRRAPDRSSSTSSDSVEWPAPWRVGQQQRSRAVRAPVREPDREEPGHAGPVPGSRLRARGPGEGSMRSTVRSWLSSSRRSRGRAGWEPEGGLVELGGQAAGAERPKAALLVEERRPGRSRARAARAP